MHPPMRPEARRENLRSALYYIVGEMQFAHGPPMSPLNLRPVFPAQQGRHRRKFRETSHSGGGPSIALSTEDTMPRDQATKQTNPFYVQRAAPNVSPIP